MKTEPIKKALAAKTIDGVSVELTLGSTSKYWIASNTRNGMIIAKCKNYDVLLVTAQIDKKTVRNIRE